MGFDMIKPAFHRDFSHSTPSTPQNFECMKECSLYLRLLLDDRHVSRSKLVSRGLMTALLLRPDFRL